MVVSGLGGNILATATGMLRKSGYWLSDDSILTEGRGSKNIRNASKIGISPCKITRFSRRMSVMLQNERPGRIVSVQRMGVLV